MGARLILNRSVHRRGVSIATVLILGALGLALALTLAGMTFSHLSVSTKLSNASQARSLAEAAIGQGIERLVTNQGKAFEKAPTDGGPVPLGLTVTMAHLEGGRGRLTFNETEADDWDMTVSTYNLNSQSVVAPDGRVVPDRAVRFVAEGEYRGTKKTIEAIVYIPEYPYSVASKGKFYSSGALTIAGAEDFAAVLADDFEDNMEPGHLASNSSDSADALTLTESGGEVLVTGDVKSVGSISAVSTAEIRGDQRPNDESVDLPEINFADFDPYNFGAPQTLTAQPDGSLYPTQNLEGLRRYEGDVSLEKAKFPSGANDGALLWVDGDVTINQELSGTGALFATGNIYINNAGQVNLDAGDNMAIVAGGDLRINGRGNSADAAFMRGVLVAGGETELSQVTVAGVLAGGETEYVDPDKGIDQSLGSSDPTVTLTDAQIIHIPTEIDFSFTWPFMGGLGGMGGGTLDFEFSQNPSEPINLQARDGSPNGGDPMEISHFYNPETGDFEADIRNWNGFDQYSYNEDTHTYSGSPIGFKNMATGEFFKDQAEVEAWMIKVVEVEGATIKTTGNPDPGYSTWQAYFDADEKFNDFSGIIGEHRRFFLEATGPNDPRGMEGKRVLANKWYNDHFGQDQSGGTFTLNPNQFVSWDTRPKVVIWREL
jgi:hypothetical protein